MDIVDKEKALDRFLAAYPNNGGPYFVNGAGRTMQNKMTKSSEPQEIRLADFAALIDEEITLDDGSGDTKTEFKISGEYAGIPLPAISISSSMFASMAWPFDQWGTRGAVAPGQGKKEYLRDAIIQASQKNVKRTRVFTHLGWRKIGAEWVYIHAGGVLCGGGLPCFESRADLSRVGLDGFEFNFLDNETGAASLELLDCASHAVAIPLLAYAHLAPLCTWLELANCAPGFTMFLLGRTQTRKTTICALAQAFFGRGWTARHLPASFDDTPNALRAKAHYCRDALLVVDDLHPTSNKREAETMRGIADSLVFAWGDRKGRSRCDSNGETKAALPPRGLGLLTGEDLPGVSESALSRFFVVPVNIGDVPIGETLNHVQALAQMGAFSDCMRRFIEWLRLQADKMIHSLPDTFDRYRAEEIAAGGMRDRLTEAVAHLRLAWGICLEYLRDTGSISAERQAELSAEGTAIFRQLARAQTSDVQELNPCEIFLAALRDMLAVGEVRLLSMHEKNASPDVIGYQDEKIVYLIKGQAFRAVYEYTTRKGESFPVAEKTLTSRLAEGGYLELGEKGGKCDRVNRQKVIAGKNRRWLFLYRAKLEPPAQEGEI